MSKPQSASPFNFDTEFSATGDILSGPGQNHFSRAEVDRMIGEAMARSALQAGERGAAALIEIAAKLTPVEPQLCAISEVLRREAAELALIAARKIAGAALDAGGQATAAEAIEAAIRLIKGKPRIIVSVRAEDLAEVASRLSAFQGGQLADRIDVEANPAAKPGDWRVEWDNGAAEFSRDKVEAVIQAVLDRATSSPLSQQLDIFKAA
ncbi:hypothetical protein GC169_02460 [bacterium]|nr:hypothetical protein [bacterium]